VDVAAVTLRCAQPALNVGISMKEKPFEKFNIAAWHGSNATSPTRRINFPPSIRFLKISSRNLIPPLDRLRTHCFFQHSS
jgi:hypothetical protein